MSSYDVFAAYYDALMQNAGYAERAAAYRELLCRYGAEDGILLDLACGTGNMALEMCRYGYDVIGADASAAMLSEAQRKAAEEDKNILFLCQPMQCLDLFGTVRATICALDSLNHLTRKADVEETIRRVALFTEPGGVFVFDVNTVYKHRHILADNAFVLETDDVFCVWQNAYRAKDDSVRITLDFFTEDGGVYLRSTESFRERAYDTQWLCMILERYGFAVCEVLSAETLQPPTGDTQRLIVAAKKGE